MYIKDIYYPLLYNKNKCELLNTVGFQLCRSKTQMLLVSSPAAACGIVHSKLITLIVMTNMSNNISSYIIFLIYFLIKKY